MWGYEEKISIFYNAHIRGTPLSEDAVKAGEIFDKIRNKCNYKMSDIEIHETISHVLFYNQMEDILK